MPWFQDDLPSSSADTDILPWSGKLMETNQGRIPWDTTWHHNMFKHVQTKPFLQRFTWRCSSRMGPEPSPCTMKWWSFWVSHCKGIQTHFPFPSSFKIIQDPHLKFSVSICIVQLWIVSMLWKMVYPKLFSTLNIYANISFHIHQVYLNHPSHTLPIPSRPFSRWPSLLIRRGQFRVAPRLPGLGHQPTADLRPSEHRAALWGHC